MAHIIVDERLYDQEFMLKYTVAPFLVRKDNGLFLRDESNQYWCGIKPLRSVSVAAQTNEIAAVSPAWKAIIPSTA